MDRIQEYPGQTPIPVEDFLNQRVADMIALGELVESLLGSSTMVDGLDCTPTSPASMSVNVARGRIYMSAPIDTTDFGDLSPTVAVNGRSAIPNATNIMKQGLLLSPSTFALTAPATAGYSVNYLIQATFEEVDDQNNVLNYFTSLTSPPLSGPSGNGTSQPQLRKGMCVLELKQGAAAATGTQQTPAVDSGYVGLWVITVANGAVSVVAANISQYSGAPFLSQKLFNLMNGGPVTVGDSTAGTSDAVPRSQADQLYLTGIAFADTGTANAYVVADSNVTALVAGQRCDFLAANTNVAGACTLDFAGLGALPIQDKYGNDPSAGVIQGGEVTTVKLNSGKTAWILSGADAVPSQSLTTPGYMQFANGFMIQWGAESVNNTQVTFKKPFPNACFGVVTGASSTSAANINTAAGNVSTTGFTWFQSGNSGWWIALGN